MTTPVDILIDSVLDEMNTKGPNSEDYPKLLTNLKGLYEIRAQERRKSISPDTYAIVGGNLIGILMIIAYEQKHVMTSKALSHIIRPK